MSQTLTDRVEAIKNTPGTGEAAQVAELNTNFDKFDHHFIPAACLKSTSNQSIPHNVATKVAYSSVSFDSYAARSEGAMASATNDEITIRKLGLYGIKIGGAFDPHDTGTRRLDLLKSGVPQCSVIWDGFLGGAAAMVLTKDLVLAVDDIISARVFHTAGAPLDWNHNTFAEGNFLSVVWLGNVTEV